MIDREVFEDAVRGAVSRAIEAALPRIVKAIVEAKQPERLTVRQWATQRGISVAAAHKKVARGSLKVERVGRSVFIVDEGTT